MILESVGLDVMQRRTFLATAAAGLAAGSAGCLATAQSTDPVQSTDETRIRVSGSGTITTDPEIAELTVAVIERGSDATEVGAALADRSQQLRSALLETAIDDADITTSEYRIDQDRERDTLRGIHAYRVTVRDLAAVGDTIDLALESGATEVERVTYTISTSTRETLREDALRAAMDDARDTAEVIAVKQGLTITRVDEVTTNQVRVGPIRTEAFAAADTATQIDEGQVTVDASVQVVYVATAAA
ncbi:MAG: SIMPL domain-containing protein [Salinarchaeum sp.]